MPKTLLKEKLRVAQGNVSTATGEPLHPENYMVDTHRKIPRREGGRYTDDNTELIEPEEHQKKHKTKPARDPELQELKDAIDKFKWLQSARCRLNNQIDAIDRRTDTVGASTIALLTAHLDAMKAEEDAAEKFMHKELRKLRDQYPIIRIAEKVKGVGPTIIAFMLVYINPHIANSVSKVWSYVGIGVASHKRYEKNKEGGGNKRLRSQLHVWAEGQVKLNGLKTANPKAKDPDRINPLGPYSQLLFDSKEEKKYSRALTMTRLTGRTGIHEMPWCEVSDGHRHGHGLRVIKKRMLFDWWHTYRTLLGLSTRSLWIEERGEGEHTISPPSDRGWIIPPKLLQPKQES